MGSDSYTLEEHIDVFDIAEGVSLHVSADPDTGSMVNIRTADELSKKFYGDLYISMVPSAALLLARALKLGVAAVVQRMNNPPEEGHHTTLRKFRVYNDDTGGYIEVRPNPDDFSYLQLHTPEKEGKDWWGNIDLSLVPSHAIELAKAIELIETGLENK